VRFQNDLALAILIFDLQNTNFYNKLRIAPTRNKLQVQRSQIALGIRIH